MHHIISDAPYTIKLFTKGRAIDRNGELVPTIAILQKPDVLAKREI
jgi:hypothetical protein